MEKKIEKKKETLVDEMKGLRPNSSVNFNASSATYNRIKKKSGGIFIIN
jgi:hypothetical protein